MGPTPVGAPAIYPQGRQAHPQGDGTRLQACPHICATYGVMEQPRVSGSTRSGMVFLSRSEDGEAIFDFVRQESTRETVCLTGRGVRIGKEITNVT